MGIGISNKTIKQLSTFKKGNQRIAFIKLLRQAGCISYAEACYHWEEW